MCGALTLTLNERLALTDLLIRSLLHCNINIISTHQEMIDLLKSQTIYAPECTVKFLDRNKHLNYGRFQYIVTCGRTDLIGKAVVVPLKKDETGRYYLNLWELEIFKQS